MNLVDPQAWNRQARDCNPVHGRHVLHCRMLQIAAGEIVVVVVVVVGGGGDGVGERWS